MSLQCDCGSHSFHIHSRNHVMCERCAEDFFLDREFEGESGE